jgi:glycolate oxidase FAD binding subunit
VGAEIDPGIAHRVAHTHGGHATLYYASNKTGGDIQQLAAGTLTLHKRLKASLDPAGIFGPRRIHTQF